MAYKPKYLIDLHNKGEMKGFEVSQIVNSVTPNKYRITLAKIIIALEIAILIVYFMAQLGG